MSAFNVQWTIEITPLLGAVLLILLMLTLMFLVQTRFNLALAVATVMALILFLPLAPAIFLIDTVIYVVMGETDWAKGTAVLAVVSFVILLLV